MKNYFLIILNVGFFFNVFAQNPVTPVNIRTDATFENISIYYSINGDNNLNSSMSVSYREKNTGNPFTPAGPSIRAFPGIVINGKTMNLNYHACSALYLKPGTEYELQVNLDDPDGGSSVSTVTVSTKNFPNETTNYKYCIPGAGGGDGSQGNPWRGLQTAANNVKAGETVLVADGTYSAFALTTSGTSGNPITFRAENGRRAIIDGNNGAYCIRLGPASGPIRYVIIDGFLLRNANAGGASGSGYGVQSDNGSFITMKNCKTTGCNYGFAAFRANGYDGDCWIYNNEFIGNDTWQTASHTNYNGVLICGNNNVISYNTISYFCDGVRNSSASEGLANAVYSMDVHNNEISSCEDDLIELDKVYSNIRVYENRCFNALTGISAQPVYGGPYYAFNNLIYNCESTTMKWANSPAGLVFVNNTMCSNSSAFTNKEPFSNVIVKNNLVIANGAVQNWTAEDAQSTVKEFNYNAYYSGSGYSDFTFGRWGSTTYYEGLSNVHSGTGYEQFSRGSNPATAVVNWGAGYPNENTEYDPGNFNFRPTSGSNLRSAGDYVPGINAAGKTPDIGCYQFGESLPQYGVNFESTSPPVLATIGDKTVTEGNTLNIQLSSSDPDGGSRSFSVSPNLNFVTLVDNQDGTGVLQVAPNTGDAGSYNITITVTDSNAESDSETITLTVQEDAGAGNSPPVLSPIGNKTVTEGNTLNIQLSSSDPDGDSRSFSMLPILDFITLVDNQNGTGILQVAPNTGDAGTYNITITVTDTNADSDSETISITVYETAGVVNSAPVLSQIGDKRVLEESNLNVSLSAVDADEDVMYFSISPELDFITLTDNQDGTALLRISPLKGDAGTYDMVIMVTDGNNTSDSESFKIIIDKVENGNTLPVLTPIGDQFVLVDETLDITLSASDSDGDIMSFSVSPKLDFLTLQDNHNGTGKLTIAPVKGNVGKYSITVTVTDAKNGSNSDVFKVIIKNNTNSKHSEIINSGGTSLAIGSMFAREDRYFNGGQTANRPPSYSIDGTDEDPLYRSVRYGDFSYEIPVPENGPYTVRLYFAELTFLDGQFGKRVFNVDIENGKAKLVNYDINADAGPMKAVIKTFTGIEVNDKHLTIVVNTIVQNAIISAIEVISETELVTGLESNEQRLDVQIYPNPSNGIFSIELPPDAYSMKDIPYAIFNLGGKIVHQSTLRDSKEIVDISNVRKGMYILKIGDHKTEKILIH
jgi:hypothetical protein